MTHVSTVGQVRSAAVGSGRRLSAIPEGQAGARGVPSASNHWWVRTPRATGGAGSRGGDSPSVSRRGAASGWVASPATSSSDGVGACEGQFEQGGAEAYGRPSSALPGDDQVVAVEHLLRGGGLPPGSGAGHLHAPLAEGTASWSDGYRATTVAPCAVKPTGRAGSSRAMRSSTSTHGTGEAGRRRGTRRATRGRWRGPGRSSAWAGGEPLGAGHGCTTPQCPLPDAGSVTVAGEAHLAQLGEADAGPW